MKKLILLLTTLFIFSAVSAQKTHVGLQIQPNIGYFNSDTSTFSKGGSKLGFNFGLSVDYYMAENFGLGSGFLVTSCGFKSQDKIGQTNDTVRVTTYKLQYLELPLTVKLRTNKIGSLKYWGQFGLSTGLNIKSRADVIKSKGDTEIPVATNSDVSKSIGTFRAALLVGAGVEYEIGGNASVFAGLHYNNGFTDIYVPKNAKFTNSFIDLSVGVMF